MRRKISAILVTVLIMLMVMPMGAFAAVPSVQEVVSYPKRNKLSAKYYLFTKIPCLPTRS